MKLGLIGRGKWGQVYAKTLSEMGIEFKQTGRDWDSKGVDGVIIASKAESHFMIAKSLINARMPCLIEKPITFSFKRSERLLEWAEEYDKSIVFVSHTRLYSNAWREFKDSLPLIHSVEMQFGRKCKIDSKLDCGPHLISMCLDLGYDPLDAKITIKDYDLPLKVIVNGEFVFDDPPTYPTPLTVLIKEFVTAIEKGEQNIEGLKLGVKVMEYVEHGLE